MESAGRQWKDGASGERKDGEVTCQARALLCGRDVQGFVFNRRAIGGGEVGWSFPQDPGPKSKSNIRQCWEVSAPQLLS